MKTLKSLLLVSLCIGVVAPAAARPRVPVAAWPGVGDVLLNLTVDAPLATVPVVPLATWLGVEDSPVPVPVTMWCADLTLLRLSAEFRRWDGFEDQTALAPPGISVYTKTVDVPDTCDTLYVTISATGDAHGGSQILLTCLVDGAFCNPGAGDGGNPPVPAGWISLQRHGPVDDFHDNNVNYQWCKQVTPGSQVTVQIRLARGDGVAVGDNRVFLQQEHFYIDASQTSGGCVAGSTD